MAEVRQSSDGQQYVLERGRYRAVTPDEAEILAGSYRGVAIKSALADIYSLGNVIAGGLLSDPRLGLPAEIPRTRFEAAGPHAQLAEAIRRVRPEAAQSGDALIDVGATGLGFGLAGATRAGRGAQAAARITSAARPDVGDVADSGTFGASSVGAAQAGEVKGLGKLFRFVTDRLENPRNLSADQFEILEARLWDDVGFEFPPGSLNSEQLYASYLSNPFTRAAIEPSLVANSARLGERFIAAVGLDPAQFQRGMGRGVVSAARRRFRGIFNQLADTVDGADLSDIAEDLAPYMTRETRQALQEGAGEVDGRTLFSIRSRIRKAQDRAWKNPDEQQIVALDDLAEALDSKITERLPDDMVQLWNRTREQYRTFKVLERPGVINRETGDLSLKSLAIRLEDQYDDFFELSPAELAQAQFLNSETGELLKFARVARSFADSIADSGTATRSALQTLATNPKAAGKMVVLRHALEAGARSPDEALALAQ